MKKMNILLITTALFSSCIATDLSDLDSLYINTKGAIEVSPVQTATSSNDSQNTTTTNSNVDSELTDKDSCELLFCGNLESFKSVLKEGDKVEFGYGLATIEGIYILENQDVWRDWYDEQYGIREEVSLVRYIYDEKVNGKTVVIETFYNQDHGEFLFGRVLYQGDYAQENMKNFILKLYYSEARSDFDAEYKFSDNEWSTYYDNADDLLKSLTRYIGEL